MILYCIIEYHTIICYAMLCAVPTDSARLRVARCSSAASGRHQRRPVLYDTMI